MAARTFADWTVENSSTTGTGTYSLAGAPSGTSYFTFRQQYDDGETNVTYWVTNASGTKWEKNQGGTLTYGTPDTLSRNVVESTNADAAVPWVAGDAPMLVYVVADSDVQEGVVTGFLGTDRHALLRYGLWSDEDNPSSGKNALKFYDGTNDIDVAVVDTSDSTMVLDPSLSAWRELGTASPSAASSVDFIDIPDTINHIMVVFELRPGTDAVGIELTTYGDDGVRDTGASDYSWLTDGVNTNPSAVPAADTTDDAIALAASVDSAGTVGVSGKILAANIQASTDTKFIYGSTYLDGAGSLGVLLNGMGWRREADRITGLRIAASSGTITGKVTLYGSV